MPIEIIWSALARTRLSEIRAYVSQDKPVAAEQLSIRLVAVIESLRNHPHLGRPGAVAGTRELVIGNVPYVVVYRLIGSQIRIETIWHGAQRR